VGYQGFDGCAALALAFGSRNLRMVGALAGEGKRSDVPGGFVFLCPGTRGTPVVHGVGGLETYADTPLQADSAEPGCGILTRSYRRISARRHGGTAEKFDRVVPLGQDPTESGARTSEERTLAETYSGEFYCVKCKAKREATGEVQVNDKGTRMAKAKCPVCGTNLNRILGKA